MSLLKTKIEMVIESLEGLGTRNIKHIKGRTLYDHLIRVQKILARWNCDLDTQLAGLCHSLYRTEYFTQHVLDVEDRNVLKKIIGDHAEYLVYMFSIIGRDSLVFIPEKNYFEFKQYQTGETYTCNHDDGIALATIMFANDLDHIDLVGASAQRNNFIRYKRLREFLISSAQSELDLLIYPETKKSVSTNTFIRFIAHSGVQIADRSVSIVIDPWLYDSSRECPIIQGVDSTKFTIDYLIPEPRNTAHELAPDIVCLSHFHTHHAPLREIIAFAKIKAITVICPPLSKNALTILRERTGPYIFDRIHFRHIDRDQEIKILGAKINSKVHGIQNSHIAYEIILNDKHILHIVDAMGDSNNKETLEFADEWKNIQQSKPDFLFIGAAHHMNRRIKDGVRMIDGISSFSPLQAARIASQILPKKVGVIGIYNHSVWMNRHEACLDTDIAENQFYWCLSFLAPSIEVKKLLPGDTFY